MIFLYNYKIESIVEKIEQAEKDGQLGSYQVSVINGHLVDFEGTQLTVSEVSQLFSELAHHQYSNSNAFDQFFTKITNVVDQEKVKTQNPIWKQLAQSLQSYHNDFKEIAAELAFLRQLTDELKAFDVHQPLLDELKVFFVRSSVDLKKIREVQAQVLEELIKCEGQPVSKYAAQLAQVMLKSCAANEPIILDRGNYLHLAARSGNVEVAKEAIWQAGDRFAADVSAYNKVGAPPLMIALGLGHYEVAQLLLDAGADVNQRDADGICPLHFAVLVNNELALSFCLKQDQINLLTGNYDGRTALHLAAEKGHVAVLSRLLQEPGMDLQVPDYYGMTALELALRGAKDASIELLGGSPKSDSRYGVPLISIDQEHILDKLKTYLEMKNRDPMLLWQGHCNGFAFLYQYYLTINHEKDFFKTLELIASWDGSKEGLKEVDVSDVFGHYQNLEEVMEQWSNDIIWFMHKFKNVHPTVPQPEIVTSTMQQSSSVTGWLQSSRRHQFEVVKAHTNLNVQLFYPAETALLNQKQLIEFFKIWSSFPNAIIEIGGDQHATSCRIFDDHRFSFYDPNGLYQMRRLNDAADFVQVMMDKKYRSLGKHSEVKDLVLQAYFMDELSFSKVVKLPEELYADAEKGVSAMKFTPLHLAIYGGDIARFQRYLGKTDLDHADANGMTPIDLAVWLDRREMIDRLMDASDRIPIDRIILRGSYDLARSLLGPQMLLDEHVFGESLMFVEGVDFLKDVLRSSVSLAPESYLIGHAVQLGEKELIQLLLKRKASLRCPTLADPLLTTKLYAELLDDINAVDYAGNSLLHYAVKDDSEASVEYLLEQGANPNLPDRNGKTAKELAQSPAMRSLFYKGAL